MLSDLPAYKCWFRLIVKQLIGLIYKLMLQGSTSRQIQIIAGRYGTALPDVIRSIARKCVRLLLVRVSISNSVKLSAVVLYVGAEPRYTMTENPRCSK